MRRFALLLICALTLVGFTASQCSAQILPKKKKVDKSTETTNTVEPDKQLYDKAIEDIKHGKHEMGRLNLQTLINTYPDSEYLAKAKLAIADSYYKEGGTSNMTQASQGYKDFIVFFPFLPEAAYAQAASSQCAISSRWPNRTATAPSPRRRRRIPDISDKYPNDPLGDKAQQNLRDVQEVLAEGDYRIAYYYYVKGDKRAAASRLTSITTRYPLYSKIRQALWMLGDLYETSEKQEIATKYYAQIVRNYPKSDKCGRRKVEIEGLQHADSASGSDGAGVDDREPERAATERERGPQIIWHIPSRPGCSHRGQERSAADGSGERSAGNGYLGGSQGVDDGEWRRCAGLQCGHRNREAGRSSTTATDEYQRG